MLLYSKWLGEKMGNVCLYETRVNSKLYLSMYFYLHVKGRKKHQVLLKGMLQI